MASEQEKFTVEDAHVDDSKMLEDSASVPSVGELANAERILPKSAIERQAALRAAMDADPGPSAFSRCGVEWFFVCFVVLCCSGDSGMDGTVMSAINSMSQYQQYFNLQAASSKTGIVFGIYTVGQLASFIPTAILPDKLGRRWSMFIGNLCLIIGALITANATNMSMFIGGRFLTGLGCTTASISSRSYMAEIASPATRGRYIGLLNSFYYIGQIVASGIAIPTGRYSTNWAWRAPIYVQGVPALVNVLFVMLIPESPRWLFTRGHADKAGMILAKYHSRNNDVNSPLVQLQLKEFEEAISTDGADKRWWDFRPLFRTRSDRYRIFLVSVNAVGGTWAGNGLVTNYLTILLDQAGITDSDRQRVLNFVNSVTSFIGALIGTATVDYLGRRTLVLTGIFCCGAGMIIIAGLLSTAGSNVAQANAGVTFIFLFMVIFSFGWTPMQALYPAEVLSFESRAKGVAWNTLFAQAANCVNTFALPVALENIQWKTYIIFGVFDFALLIVVYIYYIEPKQLTLEELDQVFESENPKQTSFELQKVARERRRALAKAHAEAHGAKA